jgi:hypothetical protein
MRVYKFLSAQWAIKDVQQHRLKISQFADLNDPFELLGVDLSNRALRHAFRVLKKHAEENWGVLCFSRTWENPLLWSHYADKHRGVCLGLDVSGKWITEVTYASSRFRWQLAAALAAPGKGERLIRSLFSTKFRDWIYEDEVRVLIMLKQEQKDGNHYFADFDADMKLREIIFGPRCAMLDQTALRSAVRAYNDEIRLVKARLAFHSFKIVRDLRGPRVKLPPHSIAVDTVRDSE